MPSVHTQIEIAAPPSEVRKVFLDNTKYPEWSKNLVKSIEPANGGPLEAAKPGDTLKVALVGMSFSTTVLDNTPSLFKWRGSIPLLFSGDHRFAFEPNTTTPGGTTFTQAEDFSGLLSFLVAPGWSQGRKTVEGFEGFNRELKARVEGLGNGGGE